MKLQSQFTKSAAVFVQIEVTLFTQCWAIFLHHMMLMSTTVFDNLTVMLCQILPRLLIQILEPPLSVVV